MNAAQALTAALRVGRNRTRSPLPKLEIVILFRDRSRYCLHDLDRRRARLIVLSTASAKDSSSNADAFSNDRTRKALSFSSFEPIDNNDGGGGELARCGRERLPEIVVDAEIAPMRR